MHYKRATLEFIINVALCARWGNFFTFCFLNCPLFLDYFPSPTRIMHEIQSLLVTSLQQQSQQISTYHPDTKNQRLPQQPQTNHRPTIQQNSVNSTPKVAPPRPPRTKRPNVRIQSIIILSKSRVTSVFN